MSWERQETGRERPSVDGALSTRGRRRRRSLAEEFLEPWRAAQGFEIRIDPKPTWRQDVRHAEERLEGIECLRGISRSRCRLGRAGAAHVRPVITVLGERQRFSSALGVSRSLLRPTEVGEREGEDAASSGCRTLSATERPCLASSPR